MTVLRKLSLTDLLEGGGEICPSTSFPYSPGCRKEEGFISNSAVSFPSIYSAYSTALEASQQHCWRHFLQVWEGHQREPQVTCGVRHISPFSGGGVPIWWPRASYLTKAANK